MKIYRYMHAYSSIKHFASAIVFYNLPRKNSCVTNNGLLICDNYLFLNRCLDFVIYEKKTRKNSDRLSQKGSLCFTHQNVGVCNIWYRIPAKSVPCGFSIAWVLKLSAFISCYNFFFFFLFTLFRVGFFIRSLPYGS